MVDVRKAEAGWPVALISEVPFSPRLTGTRRIPVVNG